MKGEEYGWWSVEDGNSTARTSRRLLVSVCLSHTDSLRPAKTPPDVKENYIFFTYKQLLNTFIPEGSLCDIHPFISVRI